MMYEYEWVEYSSLTKCALWRPRITSSIKLNSVPAWGYYTTLVMLGLTPWFHRAPLFNIVCLQRFCSVLHMTLYSTHISEVENCVICGIFFTSSACPYLVIFFLLFLCFYHGWAVFIVKRFLLCLCLELKYDPQSAQNVLFWKLAGFSVVFLSLPFHLMQSVLCSLTWLPSKTLLVGILQQRSTSERCFWDVCAMAHLVDSANS